MPYDDSPKFRKQNRNQNIRTRNNLPSTKVTAATNMTVYNSANFIENPNKQTNVQSININVSVGDQMDSGDDEEELDLCVSDDEGTPYHGDRGYDQANVRPEEDKKKKSMLNQFRDAMSEVFEAAEPE